MQQVLNKLVSKILGSVYSLVKLINWRREVTTTIGLVFLCATSAQSQWESGKIDKHHNLLELDSRLEDLPQFPQQSTYDKPQGFLVQEAPHLSGQPSDNVFPFGPPITLPLEHNDVSPKVPQKRILGRKGWNEVPANPPDAIPQYFPDIKDLPAVQNVITKFGNLGTGKSKGKCGSLADEFYENWEELDKKRVSQSLTREEIQSLNNKFSEYDNHCLRSDYKHDKHISDRVLKVVGLLVVNDQKKLPFCTVTLIGPDIVITNRHCFITREGGYDTGCWKFFDPGLSVRFLHKSQYQDESQEKFYKVKSILGGKQCNQIQEKYSINNDSIKLKLEEEVLDITPASIIDDYKPITPGTVIWLIGYSEYVHVINELINHQSEDEGVRYSPDGTCAVLSTTEYCIYHTCQTAPRMSGAGMLLTKDNGEVELIGIHVGSSKGLYKECGRNYRKADKLNLGLCL